MKTYLLPFFCIFLINNISAQFHDTQGKLDISDSGQSVYTLPISLPPSIQNVGPKIDLQYSSGQIGGIAGQGWNLSSISTIYRVSSRKDIDGFIDAVDFDDNDKLSLDGQRLISKTGSYWADGSTYETEFQSNFKIELMGQDSNIYFVVTNADGSRSWYGNFGGMNATDQTAYYITRYEDANGNFIVYNYTNYTPAGSAPKLYLTNIQFSANTVSNTTPLNNITFTYRDAARTETTYIKGLKLIKSKILSKIEVNTNNLLFKKYELTHTADSQLGYEKLTKIQEYNNSGEAANPIELEYYNTNRGNLDWAGDEASYTYRGGTDFSGFSKSGDFDGDGEMDVVCNNKLYRNILRNTINAIPVIDMPLNVPMQFTAMTVKDNKLNDRESFVNCELGKFSNFTFKAYNLNSITSAIALDYTRTIPNLNNTTVTGGNPPWVGTCVNNGGSEPTPANYLASGDFNGDGITEVLITQETGCQKNLALDRVWNPNNGGFYETICTETRNCTGNKTMWVDLNPNSTFPAGYYTLYNWSTIFPHSSYTKTITLDFNGDGKTDVLRVYDGNKYIIATLRESKTAPNLVCEKIGEGTLGDYTATKSVLFGDYNGDGKMDIIMPTTEGCSGCNWWAIYYSDPNPAGGEYFDKEYHQIVEYWPDTNSAPMNDSHMTSEYFAMDTNNDGKSDLIRVFRNTWRSSPFWDPDNWDFQWKVFAYINNVGNTSVRTFIQDGAAANHPFSTDRNMICIAASSSSRVNRSFGTRQNELAMINLTENLITHFDFTKDVNSENLIKVKQSANGGILDEIEYVSAKLEVPFVYSILDPVNYPLVRYRSIPSLKLVSKLKNTTLGISRFQEFKYVDYVSDYSGVGPIGFAKTARTSWYLTENDQKIWNATVNDRNNRNATLRTFTRLNAANESFNFSETGSIISRTENTYVPATIDPVSKKYTLLLQSKKTTDLLTNVVNEQTFQEYTTDGYYLPKIVLNKNYLGANLQGTTKTTTLYSNAINGTGSSYYIGRPYEITTEVSAYGNTQTTSEKLFYNNGNVTRTEKKPVSDAVTLVEEMDYFPNGNLKTKTLSAIGTTALNQVTPRVTAYTYDSTNRFIKTTLDFQGILTTNDTYHTIYGLPLIVTNNTFGQTTTNQYDMWGKRTKITDFLGKSINYAYTKVPEGYTTTETSDDGNVSSITSDALAREIRRGKKNIDGVWSYKDTRYDAFSRKSQESEPYSGTDTPKWSTIEYDVYSRPIKNISFTGKMINTTYDGLEITIRDGVTTKKVIKNSNSHIVSSTDTPGGTITYSYDAVGNLLSSSYSGAVLTMQYDAWGRKTSLSDPSAGLYTYNYNAFGETILETTPKGTTTYTLNAFGKPLTKRVLGATSAENTDILSTYNYDPTYKWLNSINVTNPNDGNSSYAYTYDTSGTNTKQLKKTVETTPQAVFTRDLTFDGFGRVLTETSTATANGKSATKTIYNTYKNGAHWQMKDTNLSGSILWQTNNTNAKGQLTSATLGNGISIQNSFDEFGFPAKIKHDLTTTSTVNIMTLDTKFNAVRGNLDYRNNSLFDMYEEFKYDDLDRLKSWMNSDGIIWNCQFNTDTEGFQDNQDMQHDNYFYNNSGKLVANLSGEGAGIEKQISTNTTIGKVFRITFDVEMPTVLNDCRLFATVYESNPATGEKIGNLNYTLQMNATGSYDLTYTVTQFTDVYFKLFIDRGRPFPMMQITLDNLKVKAMINNIQEYDDQGKIIANNLGTYNYTNNQKPFQNTSIKPITPAAKISLASTQTITYNAFKSPIEIIQSTERISFGYNAMEDRSVMYYGSNNANKLLRPTRKYYSSDGSMEIKYALTGETEFVLYLGGDAYSAPLLVKSDGVNPINANNNYYLHRDYLGSIVAITNNTGGIVEKRHFDAWGNALKIQNGTGNTLPKLTFTDRGYTGHEHMQGVGLINMNGRVYDPSLHRFLQPDNYVQDPFSTQNYNRYGYCVNNPFKYTDPSGENAIVIGIVVAVASYLITSAINHTAITYPGLMFSAISGAIGGAVTSGIGSVALTINDFWIRATFQTVAHGIFQGSMAAVSGGKFWTGFAAGSVSSLGASMWTGGGAGEWQGIGGQFADSGVGTIAFGTISGGAGAALTGGNFWQGAVTGLIVSGLNHVSHMKDMRKFMRNRFHKLDPDAVPKKNMKSVNDVFQDVDELESFHKDSGNYEIVIDLKTANGNRGYTINEKIYLYKGAFKSNLWLASTIFHESYHAYQETWHNGQIYSDLFTRFGGAGPRMNSELERQAYMFEWLMGNQHSDILEQIRRNTIN
ncbi:hypothetical protein FNO01nite_08500 [Flavobacterium noncentrifugens]|uniref:RHS repeat-associated core domain-containing protein n=1 Tax=Flavobacterium noncentrifugens TaxID=1128970 RepID=A0A1G8TCU0_9FLAO|nr:RHS repeat-associated core domain-containing protein [Flavobacterium noncentrifugens]GEP50178.1 hypothetical protein FNO01nite_08500 [Flavobacterium noncentrifugens]SDJ39386.1 RHS repeat-associated core domain-containing protein [Flavobacterium noncentrifugens]